MCAFCKAEIEAAKALTDSIEGWLKPEEGLFLYQLARNCKGKGVIVEIGSWKGKSTTWLAKGSKAGSNMKVYAIDPHTGSSENIQKLGRVWTYQEYKRNIERAGVDDIVISICKTSEEAAREWDGKAIELLWIDGAHEYELVKLDFELWSPYLVEGGIIAFHDTIEWKGPRKLVKEAIYGSRSYSDVGFIHSLTYARKSYSNSRAQRLRNHWVLFIKDVCSLGFKLQPPASVKSMGKKIAGRIQ